MSSELNKPKTGTVPQEMISALADAAPEEIQDYLRGFAQDLAGEIAEAVPEQSGEILRMLIAELALSAASQQLRAERRERQRETVAAAKARGVQLGRRRSALPDDFDECYQAWRDGELSIKKAAESCGMNRSSFRRAVERREQEWAAGQRQ